MGWSCDIKSSETMDKLFSLCDEDGLIHYHGEKYLCEVDTTKEYEDGRIKIDVYKITKIGHHTVGTKIGSFFIIDGKISQTAKKKFHFLNLI